MENKIRLLNIRGLIVAYKLFIVYINNLYFFICYLRDYADGGTGADNFEG